MVSSFKDYVSCRPTEFSEEDVLLCESRYIDTEKQMKKFKGLKRFSFSPKVVEDETLYFRLVCESRLAIKNYKLCLILLGGGACSDLVGNQLHHRRKHHPFWIRR